MAIIVIVLLAALLAVRFLIGGDEDTWLCENGVWVEHGHPSAPMPSAACGRAVPTTLKFATSSPVAGSCPEFVNCMPGPDVNRTCVIPPGCEGITQKAY